MITQQELKEFLSYDAETGIFTWIVDYSSVKAGDVAGSLHWTGYVVIRIRRRLYPAHGLAFVYMMGEWPKEEVDHINGRREDNRWDNLRECSSAQNNINKSMYRNNSSSVPGIRWKKELKKWLARIGYQGKEIHLGYFQNKIEAATARRIAEAKYFGEFLRVK